MNFLSLLSITLLLSSCFLPTIYCKRSFGVGNRRTKSQKSYSARREGRGHSQSDHHEPIPKPVPPKGISKSEPPLSKSSAHQTNHNPSAPPQPGWNTGHHNNPQGPPPAYPGLGSQHSGPGHVQPPAYTPYNQGGGFSPYGAGGYPQQPQMGMPYQQPGMGGMGMPYQQPMGQMPYMVQQPQRSSGGGIGVGSLLTGMAVGGVATSLVGGMIPRRHITEQHIHHYDHSDKDDSPQAPAVVPQQPQEGLAPLVTPDPVPLAPMPQQPQQQQNQFSGAQEQPIQSEPAPPPQIDPIYSFNYAPAYVQHTLAPPTQDQVTQDTQQTSTEKTES